MADPKKRKKPATTKPKKEKAQKEIPGTEPEEIEEIEDAAAPYFAVVRQRMNLQKEESDLKTNMKAVIRGLIDEGVIKIDPTKASQVVYRFEDEHGDIYDVIWEITDNVKVKLFKPDGD